MPAVADVLAAARATGDVDLQLCPYLTDQLCLDPPYKVAIVHLLLQKRLLLKDPVGVGKTASALGAYGYFRHTTDRPVRLLVLGTATAQFQWQSEVHRLTTFDALVYGYERRTPLDAATRQQRYLDRVTGQPGAPDVWITTYELAARDVTPLLQVPYVLVFDEIQFLRGSDQKVLHPAAVQLSQHALATWGLSATPYMNKYEDLHGVYDALVPGLLGTIWQFRHTYIRTIKLQRKHPVTKHPIGPKFPKIIGYKRTDQLRGIIAPYTLSRTEADFGTYMPTIAPLERVDVEMGLAQRTLYDAYLKQLPDQYGAPTISQKMTAVLYAQMITDAPAVLGYPDIPSAKLDGLLEKLTAFEGEQVVVYTFFASVARWLQTALQHAKIPTGLITGAMRAPARADVQDAFQTQRLRVVIVTNAGVYSVNLRAPHFVFFDLPWIWGNSVQAVGRARRRALPGQTPGTLTVSAVMATGTVNESTLSALRESQERSTGFYAPLTRRRPSTVTSHPTPTPKLPTENLSDPSAKCPILQKKKQQQKHIVERSSSNALVVPITNIDLDLDLGAADVFRPLSGPAADEEAASLSTLWASLVGNEAPADVGPAPVFSAVGDSHEQEEP